MLDSLGGLAAKRSRRKTGENLTLVVGTGVAGSARQEEDAPEAVDEVQALIPMPDLRNFFSLVHFAWTLGL